MVLLQTLPDTVAAKKSPDLLLSLKSNPKEFVAQMEQLDPVALTNVITLLEDLLSTSEAREAQLIDELDDASTALGAAAQDVVEKENSKNSADQAVIDTQEAADQAVANAQQVADTASTDLDNARSHHAAKQTVWNAAQTAHDHELPGLNNEQQVLRDVIAMLKGLPEHQGLDCDEARGLDNLFPVIAGAKWEFTNDWDCGGSDISWQSAPSWDGSETAIERRMDCAQRCLDAPNCAGFNYPQEGGGTCYWKHTFQKSTELGKDCGIPASNWQYYTLLDRNPCNA